MVVEMKTSKASVGFQPQKPWLRSQSQRSEPTPPISEDPHVFQDSPPTIIEQSSSPNVPTPDINTTAKKRGRGPTTNRNAKKRKEGSKGEVQISKRLGRAVGGEALTEFVTEMGVVLRQYAPLNVHKWAQVPTHYKDKIWDDLLRMSERNKSNRTNQSTSSICGRKSFASILHDMRDPRTDADPDLAEYWKTTHQRRSNGTWCSVQAQNALEKIEQVSQSQEELGAPPLSIEEHLTQSLGGRSGYLRGLGCGPKPLSTKNLRIKASEEYFDRQINVLKEELKQSRVEIEERVQREKIEREERFKKEIEEIKAQLQTEFNEQLKIIVGLYGVPTAPPPSSSRGVPTTSSSPTEGVPIASPPSSSRGVPTTSSPPAS